MIKAILNWRYHVLMAVGAAAILGLFSVPSENSSSWFLSMFLTKGIGFIAAYAWFKLYNYWESRNEIKELSELAKEED